MKPIYFSFLFCLLWGTERLTGKDLAVTLQIDRRIHNNSGVDVDDESYFNALYDNNEKRYTIKNGQEYLESSAFLIPEEVGGGMPKSDIERT